jgi:hypothetical protein
MGKVTKYPGPDCVQPGEESSVFHRLLVACGLLALIVSPSIAKPKGTGFDGKWVVDRKASRAMPPPPEDLTQVIRVGSDSAEISTTWKEPEGWRQPPALPGHPGHGNEVRHQWQRITKPVRPLHPDG